MKLRIGTTYRVRDASAFSGMTPGMPVLLAALVPGARGLEAVLTVLTVKGRVEFRMLADRAAAALKEPPELPEVAAAKQCGFAHWDELLAALRDGKRFTLPLPVNGDTSVDSFTRWFELLERHQLCMIPGDGRATLAAAGSFTKAELDAAATRANRFAEAVQREVPPWVKDGAIDPEYLRHP